MTGPPRVVSLVPSVTETLTAWGRVPVACTRFCERDDLSHVGGTKNPDVEAIAALAPDLVVVDVEENRREDAEALRAAGLRVHVLHIRSLSDVDEQLPGLAGAVDVAPPRPVARSPVPSRLRAIVPIWRRPWMTIGPTTYGASVLAALGVAVVPDGADAYPTLGSDELVALDADVVLTPDEPYAFEERHRSELEAFGPVVFVDGKDLFWWGARTPGALDRLAAVVDGLPASAGSP